MIVDAKEFLHTIQKHKLDRKELMVGVHELANDPFNLTIAQQKGLDFYFTFPDISIGEGKRVIQLICRKPNSPEVTGDTPAVRVYDMLKILSN